MRQLLPALLMLALNLGCNETPPEPEPPPVRETRFRSITVVVYEEPVETDPCNGAMDPAMCWRMILETREIMGACQLCETIAEQRARSCDSCHASER